METRAKPRLSRGRTSPPTIVLYASLLMAQPAIAEIFRCKDAAGGITFTDHGCAGREDRDLITLPQTNRVHGLTPSSAEQRQLKVLAERFEKAVDRQSRTGQSNAESAARELEEDDVRCRATLQELDELLAQRRSGYRLQQAQSLRERKAQLRRDKLRYC
jgi:hypothetical protein